MLKNKLRKVISGGQCGADIAGVRAARLHGLETGGTMPKGFRTLDGLRTHYAWLYGMREHWSPDYPPRTWDNVRNSDATLRFAAHWDSPGELLTLKAITTVDKPYFDVDITSSVPPATVAWWIAASGIEVLNVAGNTQRTAPGIEDFVFTYLRKVFKELGLEERKPCARMPAEL
jgi:hypothetical protein